MRLVLNRKHHHSGVLETEATFNDAGELLIYDVIMPSKEWEGDTAVTPTDVMDFMKEAGNGDLTVRINSSGGEVSSALTMFNRLLEHPGKVTTIVDGYAFSSAGWLALAGSDRQICNGALFMMHNPYMYELIDSEEAAQNVLNRWKAHRDSIVDIFTSRTEMEEEDVRNMMQKETYLSSTEAVDAGLFHSVRNTQPETAMLNCLQVPQAALNKAKLPEVDIQSLRRRMLNIRKNSLTK